MSLCLCVEYLKMKRKVFLFCVLLFFTYPVVATRYHVNINSGNDAGDGLLWSSAFKNLQAALDVAEAGDEIWIAAGVYHPTKKIADVYGTNIHPTTPTHGRHRSFLINKNISLYGGFPANPTNATSINSRNWKVHQTVLSGDFNNDDGDNFENMDENAFHVVILFDASPLMILNGLYITGGCADDIGNVYTGDTRYYYVSAADGGGLYAYSPNRNSSPTLSDVTFYGNYARQAGGGLFNFAYQQNASPRITNVSFIHNKVELGHGGGMYNNSAGGIHAELVNINVIGNESWLSGGGLYFFSIEECAPTIINSVVSGNYAGYGNGGGICMYTFDGNAEPVILNTTICGNRVAKGGSKDGGGLVIWPLGISKATIINTVIWGNKGDDIDNFFAEGDAGTDNIIRGSFIEGRDDLDDTNLSGNIDPQFLLPAHADYAPTMDGDYQLKLGSPLIDKGINRFNTLSNDLLGNPRVVDGVIDIGAYESQGKPPVSNDIFNTEKVIWGNEGTLFVQLHHASSLYVYSIDGKLVRHYKSLNEGLYQFYLPSGIYFVTLNNGIVEKVIIR